MVHGLLVVSTLITVAPWSAKNFMVSGPTTAQQNARIVIPLKAPFLLLIFSVSDISKSLSPSSSLTREKEMEYLDNPGLFINHHILPGDSYPAEYFFIMFTD